MEKRLILRLLVAAMVLMLTGCGAAYGKITKYSGSQTLKADGDISFDYHLFTPKNGQNMPIVIVFHGFGEGENIDDTKIYSTLTGADAQSVRPCYVLEPYVENNVYLAQSNRESLYKAVKEITEGLITNKQVDPDRVYVIGNSFGGLGTVEFLEYYPEFVAAAIPMCPALTYSKDSTAKLSLINDIPIWFAHATNDNVIPVDVSRSAVFTIKNAGAKDVTLTEFTDQEMLSAGALVGYHQSDFVVMTDDSFANWLFSQSRSN